MRGSVVPLNSQKRGICLLLCGRVGWGETSVFVSKTPFQFSTAESNRYEHNTYSLIVGDFNYGSINWELYQSSEALEHCSSLFTEKVKYLFLYQYMGENKRHSVGQSSSRLDLIFSNEANMVNHLEYMPPLGAGDNPCLLFKFTCYTDCKQSDEPRPNLF